jgi:hypothetical protein
LQSAEATPPEAESYHSFLDIYNLVGNAQRRYDALQDDLESMFRGARHRTARLHRNDGLDAFGSDVNSCNAKA